MNEKEMIEEMAKVMCGNDCEECAKETAQWRGCSLKKAKSEECLIKKEAKLLYEKGYRKIPEGSVVLTNDEWARLRNLEINYDDAYEEYRKYEIENQQLKKQVKELEEQRDRQAYIAEELIQEKHRWTEQARKETLEKIKLKPIECGEECGYYYLDISVTGKELLQRVYFYSDFIDGKVRKETAKEFALKVKECKEIKELVEFGYIVSYVDLCKEIDEIAKKYGVEE